ncbi:MAG TPA: UbiA family prenyltransferase [bacterium]|nr:UbiA family prenyltransferase [bacterium]
MSQSRSHLMSAVLRAIRIHQWTKNLLIFIPLIMAHKVANEEPLLRGSLAFLAFGLFASATYVLNDLIDLERDRKHPKKSARPLASGAVSVGAAWTLAVLLLAGGLAASWFLPRPFLWIVGGYFAASLLYSLRLKKIVLMDVMTLALFYTLRIFAGSVACAVPVSSWLLAYSIFIFFSLALLKRYSELKALTHEEGAFTGRGYRKGDLEPLAQLGTASGYLSVLVLALYVSSDEVTALYSHPRILWLLCPVMLYWISRIWLLAHRGSIPDEPIVFALRDRASYAAGAAAGLIVWTAS